MQTRGLVQLYTGDGKGKTSAAIGALLRAVGQGLRVCMVQFLKGGIASGEVKAIAALKAQVEVFRFGTKPDKGEDFTWVDPESPTPEDLQQARAALECSRQAINSGRYDLVVMDEVNLACAWGLLRQEEVLTLLSKKPTQVEVILTGRSAPAALIDRADLVTEMVCVKHPFHCGVEARRGIEV